MRMREENLTSTRSNRESSVGETVTLLPYTVLSMPGSKDDLHGRSALSQFSSSPFSDSFEIKCLSNVQEGSGAKA
jgi:hypothetical protein